LHHSTSIATLLLLRALPHMLFAAVTPLKLRLYNTSTSRDTAHHSSSFPLAPYLPLPALFVSLTEFTDWMSLLPSCKPNCNVRDAAVLSCAQPLTSATKFRCRTPSFVVFLNILARAEVDATSFIYETVLLAPRPCTVAAQEGARGRKNHGRRSAHFIAENHHRKQERYQCKC